MKLAFWRGRKPRPAALEEGAQPVFESPADEPESDVAAEQLRKRTRRRLIGAFALLLAAVVLVPMLLDPAPRALPESIPIELPSDRTPFTPKIAPPASEAPAASESAIPAAPGSAADSASETSNPAAPAAAQPAAPASKDAAKGASESQSKPPPAKSAVAPAARIFVQAAAMAKESKARELAERLAKSGMTPFVERTETSDGVRFRVRLGPFATRGEAERSRARLRELGVKSNIVVV
jgi:DedD protein